MALSLPRNAQIWLPGYIRSYLQTRKQSPPKRVWLTIADHFEPLRGGADIRKGLERIAPWRKLWPEIAARHRDSLGNPPVYTFFYPEEEYRPELIDPLAEMTHMGIADVEIHLHHDHETEQRFVERMAGFKQTLFRKYGLLRTQDGEIVFGFIHGNWALDNSLPDGRWCGLNNEISLLRDLRCYADFTLPSAPSPAQTRTVNQIYWAKDDPSKPKSHDIPAPDGGDLLMIPGPLALNWRERRRSILPRLENGELSSHNTVTPERVRLWLRFSPRIGGDLFIKLFTHGAYEANTQSLLGRDLEATFQAMQSEQRRLGFELNYVSPWNMYTATRAAINKGDIPLV